MIDQHVGGVRPHHQDRNGPAYAMQDIHSAILHDITNGNYFTRRAKKMTTADFDNAKEMMDTAQKGFARSLDQMLESEKALAEATKRAGGSVRKSANELGEAVQRVMKTADLDKLERYTTLLERTAAAMSTLAALENEGRLNRIASALK